MEYEERFILRVTDIYKCFMKSLEIVLINKNWYFRINSTHCAPSPGERKDNYLPYKGRSGDAIWGHKKYILSCEFDHYKKVWNFVNFFLSTYACQKINNKLFFAIKLWDPTILIYFRFSWDLTLCLRWKLPCPLILVAYLFGYSECGGGISSRPFFFKNNSSLENDLEPFKQPLNCMRCVCRVFLLKIIWNRFMVWTLCQNFGLKGNLFSVVKYKSIIQLSLGFQCYSCSQPTRCFELSMAKYFY